MFLELQKLYLGQLEHTSANGMSGYLLLLSDYEQKELLVNLDDAENSVEDKHLFQLTCFGLTTAAKLADETCVFPY